MSLKNELKFVYALAIVCLIVGIVCYSSVPAKTPEPPLRLMFKTVGGNVLFDHETHNDDYGLKCSDCHHSYDDTGNKKPKACESCHTPKSKYVPALGPDGKFDHDLHANDLGLACNDCHHNYHEEDGGEPQPCSDCHEPGKGDDFMLGRVQAFHKQCIGCHEESGVTPGANDCSGCHEPRKEVDAFHKQCIGCHEDYGVGPSGADSDCKKCHGF